MMAKYWSLLPWMTVLVAFIAMDGRTATAERKTHQVPFRVVGAGVSDFIPFAPGTANGSDHEAKGVASYIGRYSGEGRVELIEFTGPTSAHFQSSVPFVFRGRKRTLKFHYGRVDQGASQPGIVNLYSAGNNKVIAVFDAEFTLAERAGRVVDGRFRMIAVTAPFVFGEKKPVKYAWKGFGRLTIGR